MHRPMHLGVIIHFTEFETTTLKRPADRLLLAFTGKLWQVLRALFSNGKMTLHKITCTQTFHLPVKRWKQYKHT